MSVELTLGEQIAQAAESWIGTPFQHQGRSKHRAVDCANFVALVAHEVGLDNTIPNNYRRIEDGTAMLSILENHLMQVTWDERCPGDILALCDENRREPDKPRHLVIISSVTDVTTYVIDATVQGVRRHRLDGRWINRVHSVWRAYV